MNQSLYNLFWAELLLILLLLATDLIYTSYLFSSSSWIITVGRQRKKKYERIRSESALVSSNRYHSNNLLAGKTKRRCIFLQWAVYLSLEAAGGGLLSQENFLRTFYYSSHRLVCFQSEWILDNLFNLCYDKLIFKTHCRFWMTPWLRLSHSNGKAYNE